MEEPCILTPEEAKSLVTELHEITNRIYNLPTEITKQFTETESRRIAEIAEKLLNCDFMLDQYGLVSEDRH